ncbi:hypothetical protein AC578_7458 [Pseudocercospora eumusae]|uniref:Uncharacterized protein n=1 Tax=Pseudocercospora eumusae TaxID=321146 RepID=A0A139H970_9PEZI|nr:hypothetical protein AC578_7458 [Pseudocercospora eumusae]
MLSKPKYFRPGGWISTTVEFGGRNIGEVGEINTLEVDLRVSFGEESSERCEMFDLVDEHTLLGTIDPDQIEL